MDGETLRRVMELHGSAVYRLALCRLQNTADAEDVYQDVFLRLLEQDSGEWEEEHRKAWLLRVTLNRCADIRRFRLRHPVLEWQEVPGGSEDTEASELWASVSRLPEKLRTVVHLHYGEGYSTEELAQLLGCPAATVRTRLYRARTQLKDLLEGDEDG